MAPHDQTHNCVTVSTPERCRAPQTELAGVVWPAERVASEFRKRKVANLAADVCPADVNLVVVCFGSFAPKPLS